MKLIDADQMKEDIRGRNAHLSHGWDTMEILNAIDDQQAIDAKPVMHARWEHGPGGHLLECSSCHVKTSFTRPSSHLKYCFNCGAMMDRGPAHGTVHNLEV